MKQASSKPILSVFALTMITVGSVDSIRNLPATALFGSQLIVFFTLGALFFLIPCALVSAELSSRFPKQGGIYIWVKEAFGQEIGFLAVWLQWIENVIWYPALLSFVAGTIGYLISPSLIDNSHFLMSVILCSFWGVTFLNFTGMQSSAFFSSLCTITGLLLPMTLIISLGAVWIMGGKPLQVDFSLASLAPRLDDTNVWVSLTAIMLSFCGIEIATVHAADVENPQKAFPKALSISVCIILSTLILGSLAIAIVLPHDQISLVAGIMQAFHAFFANYHMLWFMPIIALMLILGGLGSVNNWIIAPTRGLLIAAKDGNLPRALQKTNRFGAPVSLLLYQALIVSALTAAFLFLPTINSAYWFLTALAAQLYMLMYLIMFLAAIKLRRKYPLQNSAYTMPGGNIGLYLITGVGILGTLVTLFVSFIPPESIKVANLASYEISLATGIFVMCLPPVFTAKLKKSHWKTKTMSDC